MLKHADMEPCAQHADMGPCACQVDDEELAAHRIILMARSPVFHALLNSEMREGVEGVVTIEDVRGPVFRALLHFVYTDCLPEVLTAIPPVYRLPAVFILAAGLSCSPAPCLRPAPCLQWLPVRSELVD